MLFVWKINRKILGLYNSSFEDFITGNCIYVDKTNIIYDLITAKDNKHYYFVSRPRRFGKSLFISTLKEIFLGKKEFLASIGSASIATMSGLNILLYT